MKIVVIGNCQAAPLANALNFLLRTKSVSPYMEGTFAAMEREKAESILGCDILFHQSNFDTSKYEIPETTKTVKFPRFMFRGFHPDSVYVYGSGKSIETKFGAYHSAIALAAYQNGKTVDETLEYFTDENFQKLGYLDAYDQSVRELIEEGRRCNLDLTDLIAKWRRSGCFMHAISHPKIEVFVDLANLLLKEQGITPWTTYSADFITDNLQRGPISAIYPAVAQNLGLDGGFAFKGPERLGARVGDLRDFVTENFSVYAKYSRDALASIPRDLSKFDVLFAEEADTPVAVEGDAPKAAVRQADSPYKGIPDYQFWSRSVLNRDVGEIDPVIRLPFSVSQSDKVATAGSCFAQHIAKTLMKIGHNYYITENPPVTMDPNEAHDKNYGVFSARYGNIYTVRQLTQLFDRAYGRFSPIDNVWQRGDGKYVDPFRPQIEPEGYETIEEMAAAREEHFAAVREMLEELDVFVFTLGLTEAWRSKRDGAVFPLAPGVAGGDFSSDEYEFVNFSARDTEEDLLKFIDQLRSVNPAAKVLLTVSPVPLIATYEDRSVITSTAYSKAALRVAVEEVCKNAPDTAYFPSYEIITGQFTHGRYYEDDLRNVKPEGVGHAMRLFVTHSVSGEEEVLPNREIELDEMFGVICDEEQIEANL